MELLKLKEALYEAEKNDLKAKNYDVEIEEEVRKYREEIKAKYETKRAAEISRIDICLDLLSELISESENLEKKNIELLMNLDDNSSNN